jgi:hypothetical protein
MDKYLKHHILYDWGVISIIDNKVYDGNWFSIDELDLKPLTSIAPNYMMEPSVTITSK